jgi:Protein of unknown function (DUF3153).
MKQVWVLMLFIFLLSGCMQYDIHMSVDQDGKIETKLEMLVSKEYLNQLETTKEQWTLEMKQNIKEIYNKIDMNFKEVTKKIDGKEYIGITACGKDKEKNDMIKIENHKMILRFLDFYKQVKEIEEIDVHQLKESGMKINLVVEMPNVPNTNVGSIKENKVYIDLLEYVCNKDKECIVISCELSQDYYMIIGIVMIGILFLIKKVRFLK